jgi:hypothetical protein
MNSAEYLGLRGTTKAGYATRIEILRIAVLIACWRHVEHRVEVVAMVRVAIAN